MPDKQGVLKMTWTSFDSLIVAMATWICGLIAAHVVGSQYFWMPIAAVFMVLGFIGLYEQRRKKHEVHT